MFIRYHKLKNGDGNFHFTARIPDDDYDPTYVQHMLSHEIENATRSCAYAAR